MSYVCSHYILEDLEFPIFLDFYCNYWKSNLEIQKKYERRKCLLTFTTTLLCSCSTFRPVLTVFRPQVRVVRRFVFNKREEEFGLRTDPSRCPQFLSLRRERGKTLFFPSSVLFLIFMIPE